MQFHHPSLFFCKLISVLLFILTFVRNIYYRRKWGKMRMPQIRKKNNPNILSAPSLSDAMKHKIMIAIFVFCFCTIFVSSHALHLANLEIEQCCTLEHEINNHCLRKCRRMRFPIIPGRAKPGRGKFVFLPPSQIAPYL